MLIIKKTKKKSSIEEEKAWPYISEIYNIFLKQQISVIYKGEKKN